MRSQLALNSEVAVRSTDASAVAPAPDDPLLELLGERFAAADGRDTGQFDPRASELPPALWQRALLDPLREFLSRPGKAIRARMVALGYTLGGGEPGRMPRALPALIEILHAGSLIVDDIEDDSAERRGAPALHRIHGVPVALNAGNWLYFWPQVLLGRMALPDGARLEAHERIAHCLLRCHEGQALDLTVRIDELERDQVPRVARALTELKTGELFGLAVSLGALSAGADARRKGALARFGREVGVGLQMLDDLSGVLNAARRHKAHEDLHHARVTWPWAWLAHELDEACYRGAVCALRTSRDAAAHDLLLSHLRLCLGSTGTRHIRRHFDDALGELSHALGGGAWCEPLRAELALLERKFLEGT